MKPTTIKSRAGLRIFSIVAACLLSGSALAQSNVTGIVAGRANAGDQVTVANPKTNFSREVTVRENGRYRVPALPVGVYVVTVARPDGTVVVNKAVRVQIGRTTTVK